MFEAVPGLPFCDPHQEQHEEGKKLEVKRGRGRPDEGKKPKDYDYVQVSKRVGFRNCAALNKHHTRCVNSARPGSDFCGCHQPKE